MSHLLSAVVRHLDINQGQTAIEVTLDRPPVWKYESCHIPRGTGYLARDGAVANFFFHAPERENGFGGRTFEFDMIDGTKVKIKGPWSSNCSTINQLFDLEDGEQLVPCVNVSRGLRTVIYVRKDALEELGIDVVWRNYVGGDDQTKEGYWEARRKAV